MVLKQYRETFRRLLAAEDGPSPIRAAELKHYLVRALFVRVVLLTISLAVVTWGLFRDGDGNFGFILIGIVLGVSLIQAVTLRRFGPKVWSAYVQLATDILLISAVFGYSESQAATFLYLLVIIAAAGALHLRGALIVATLSSVLYSTVLAGVVPGFSGMANLLPHEVLLVHLSFLVAAIFSSLLAVRLRALLNLTADQAENVRALQQREEKLLIDLTRAKAIEDTLSYHEQVTQLLASKEPAARAQRIAMVGDSAMMKNLFTLIERVAPTDASVLITGESGTGKELIARAIHELSPRCSKQFVGINCGAIPEQLIESELFGHKRGSFTGAISDNVGLFRRAQGGTLFLDEIGELPLPMQTKLLRALQDRTVRAVGDGQDIAIDVHVVAATNRDLKREIAQGRFREDLYYRLNVVNLVVPPLRERKEDLPLLIRHFLTKYCDADDVVPTISPGALQLLRDYPFPGNIRELENVIERAIVLGGNAILPDHLPEEVRQTTPGIPAAQIIQHGETQIVELPLDLDGVLAQFEREMLMRALEKTGGMKKQAAELLGLNFRSFRYRLKKYGMGGEDGRDASELA